MFFSLSGPATVRYRGLAKNANRPLVTCALANLHVARTHLLRLRQGSSPDKWESPLHAAQHASEIERNTSA